MTSVVARFQPWLESLGIAADEVVALQGDVSPRRYFRVRGAQPGSAIVVVYTAGSAADSERFLATTQWFERAVIRVPRVLAAEPAQGLLLLEDLGTVSLFDLKDKPWREIRPHLEQALDITATLCACPEAPLAEINPVLDAHRLANELASARQIFLHEPEFSGSARERGFLDSALDQLCLALELEPLVPSHRDFMSRNLMLPPGDSRLAVIDHQDACLAPRFYDSASLLNDSLFPSWQLERELMSRFLDDDDAILAYRRCAVQRTLKASATFTRFALQGFDRHLPLVAPSLAKAADHLAKLPEGKAVPESVFERWRAASAIVEGLRRLTRQARAGNATVASSERPR